MKVLISVNYIISYNDKNINAITYTHIKVLKIDIFVLMIFDMFI